jgi:hypothetical protein
VRGVRLRNGVGGDRVARRRAPGSNGTALLLRVRPRFPVLRDKSTPYSTHVFRIILNTAVGAPLLDSEPAVIGDCF